MITIKEFHVIPTSMVSQDDRQQIVIAYRCSRPAHLFLSVFGARGAIAENVPVTFDCGKRETSVLLPLQETEFEALWQITNRDGTVLAQTKQIWKRPREWTIYVMISAHMDIGLHESQYIQREECCTIVDEAVKRYEETKDREDQNRYRYTMEGSWFWSNYRMKYGDAAAKKIAKEYIQTGKIGSCAGYAGNHFQTFGLEEMCRSAYERRRLYDDWGIESKTVALIDINGMPMSMLQAYAQAGYQNVIFAPNHWNPMPSSVWKNDRNILGPDLNPEAGGYGSRVDVRYASELPMVYRWENQTGESLLVWASTQYGYGGESFGIYPRPRYYQMHPDATEDKMYKQLELLEEKYPYDIWMFACYDDNQIPDHYVTDQIKVWNGKWKWPQLRALGNPDEPFALLEERFGDRIPVIRGDMAGGWYQHPLSVPEMIFEKSEADRLLPIAEKWSAVACLTDDGYTYPQTAFDRAWYHLLMNDEHSYGVSGYSGRRVYETWMQHRDWIEKAYQTAKEESEAAMRSIASHIPTDSPSAAVFNPMAYPITEHVCVDGRYASVTVPAFGYRTVSLDDFMPLMRKQEKTASAPVIENAYYRLEFAENGAIASIYDKELQRELLDTADRYKANELVFTKDGHQSFVTPSDAVFEVESDALGIRVKVQSRVDAMGAVILQKISLPNGIKRIDLENEVQHARTMINADRYRRYLYFVFPFKVENSRRLCHLNGAVAEYAKDITGYGTDVYMAAHEWCCCENGDFGAALLLKENQLIEFDHIHPDKTDFDNTGDGSQIIAYAANDWLQKQTPGGSHLNYRFRYAITSYRGDYRAAKLMQQAERFVTPIASVVLPAQEGYLPKEQCSFLELTGEARFLCLKRADDGNGLIARFYGEHVAECFGKNCDAVRCTVDEKVTDAPLSDHGFVTYRIGKDRLRLKTREQEKGETKDGIPAPIGEVYTGLISKPCAAAGEGYGHLYLLWGASTEQDFSHYKLYRSKEAGFVPDEQTFVADVMPEEYCVGRYVDTGLEDHTCYYYRVCAVNQAGVCGEMSREFSAFTREAFFD